MGSSRHFLAFALAGLSAFSGCGNLIGLGGYSVADHAADGGSSAAGTANVAGRNVAGVAGEEMSADGGTGGVPDESGGSAGESGSADIDESSGSGTVTAAAGGSTSGSSGAGGSDGTTAFCPAGCDDANDCTTDSCKLGTCAHDPLPLGAACGVGRSCDAQKLCVRCRDTASGAAQDAGCSVAAPICLGTGLDAACAGCSSAADCSDGNECTTESCIAGKCVFATVVAGSACSAGVCNGTASAEKCVACADTASASTQDAGCSSAKPLCDPSGTPTCYQCLSSSDCVTDNVSCTVETCSNHLCSHVATDTQCAPSGDACKPNKCDATLNCKQVDITSLTPIVSTAVDNGNGGFEDSMVDPSLPSQPPPADSFVAKGWLETGDYYISYECGSGGCAGTNGATFPQAPISVGGRFVAWMGSQTDSGVTQLYRAIALPTGTTNVQLLVDINLQTKSTATTNHDYFEARVLDSNLAQVGTALAALSNVNAQTGGGRAWTKDGINATRDLSALAGKPAFLMFWTSVDTSARSDFFFDNVRLVATVCK
ncbi:MAG TPA: hypothetical protein VER12_14260 [Polyangiaceae bacterium]|nr:hypothetical protein [Polyangiaceae bacterium]